MVSARANLISNVEVEHPSTIHDSSSSTEMLNWLENTLQEREGSTIIVSHDRKFLNATCNRLIEVRDGKLTCYGGSYNFYLEEQERLRIRQTKAYEAQEEEKSLLKQKIKAILFSKGKTTPPTDRNLMAYN
jgi:ATPase subunit of ABC transporter with duplicated ATPase domains